ncbi:stage IV sporulation protein A [Carboxydothermus hydrogenoformans]|uniref:Stage IV sporulation protein A n=1 Tax=Carboxydothermus hydrogenoformans (strain ATCC BAA-161 / DSM 6008 / Z-2901) TaxID=246194 RepID=Q3AAU9_CARHZ|nr:stage IV sporulation protein A [Carboxydothermus hydrogenoformans]ABB13782.1 stage IV sporulation protein A [Carboxydothermus hydrogenoformans Z-2901]
MERVDLFRDIAQRTSGNIYISAVGPVRTGKSTLIKKFMELLILPNIKNVYDRERAKDELPQSGAGRTIMTTEPKFIPNEAIEININSSVKANVRLVDVVGYPVLGALGYEEEDGPRMVLTPWFDEEIPFAEAAEIGTRKVITDHSTMAFLVTTDGSITDIPRENYLAAEERVVEELKQLEKPFIIVLNSTHPNAPETKALAEELEQKYDVTVVPVDVAEIGINDLNALLENLLYEFPLVDVNFNLPQWIEELDATHWLKEKFTSAVHEALKNVKKVKDINNAVARLSENEYVDNVELENLDMGTGQASIKVAAKEGLFYRVLEEVSGYAIRGEHELLRLMRELSYAKKEYDKVAIALKEVKETGYGVVTPRLEEMNLEEPELIRQGNRFGVRLRASAPSMHIIRADITTEITPIIGTEKQCEELVQYMLKEFEENPKKIWESEIFGKSLHDLVREGIQNKLHRMPENAQVKLQETLQRIVNDGGGGLICIII